MKILILGLGKSGTTALLYKVAGGLQDCRPFSGGKPGKNISNHPNAVFKFTYNEDKGRNLELFKGHVRDVYYDRKIWIARDPRDNAISRMLFRWYRGSKRNKEQYRACLRLVLKKERQPESVPFHTLFRFRGLTTPTLTLEQMIEGEHNMYRKMCGFLENIKNEWFVFKYEDMINKNFEALNEYLGFKVQEETEVTKAAKKVARKKASGDWRHWFTEEDVALFKPVYKTYLDLIGYDINDWQLSPRQVIEPEYASKYMKRLPRRRTMDAIRKRVFEQPFFSRKGRRGYY